MLGLRCYVGFSLVVKGGGSSSFSTQASRFGGVSRCGERALGCMGSVAAAPRALEPRINSCAQAQLLRGMWDTPPDLTCVSCTGRQILYP